MKTACLFVTWNSEALIDDSIGRLHRFVAPQDIIVVDNGSRDHTVEWLEQRYPGITLHKLPINTGFAGGNNYGLRAAMQSGYDAVFLLNVDTIIDEDCIAPCVAQLAADPLIGIIGPTVLEAQPPGIIQCEGGKILPLTLNFEYHGIGREFDRRDELREVDYVLGAAMLIRRQVIEVIGYLDEDYYPAYVEEADFCYRASRAGFRSMIHRGSAIRHIGAQSSGGNYRAFNRLSRQRYYFGIKHLGPWAFLVGAFAVTARVFYWKCRAKYFRHT